MQIDLHKPDFTTAGPVPAAPLKSLTPSSWLEGGTAVLDSAGNVLEVNESLAGWLEKSRPQLLGRSLWEAFAAFAPEWEQPLAQLRQATTPFERLSLKFVPPEAQPSQWFTLEAARANDTCFVRLNSTLPPLSELEEAIWDEHLHSDSARREMFMRLLRAEGQLDGLMRRWPCVIFSQRPDFSLQFVSPAIAELTGIAVADWTRHSRHFWELVHESDAAELQLQFKRAAVTGTGITNTFRIRHAVTGRVTYILEHRQPTISQNGLLLGYEVVWLDVTRQTIAEKRLSTAAWKETLAVLTLGMAHDFRNIMAGIHSLSESFIDQIDANHAFAEGLGLIRKSSLQASQLVQRMINLHLGQTGERNYHNLNEITTDLVELVSKILPRRIKIITELDAATLPVYADVVEFRQVVINLLLNAADAMPGGGNLTLRTARHAALPVLENMKGIVPRLPCVSLSIHDTGSGISKRHLASIFDPFFTTKTKGSGLGLYNARIALEKHRGAISVQSLEGQGTTFQVWLPEADFSETSQVTTETQPDRTRRRTLLLLGQAGELLDKTAEFLRTHNYHVVIATSPESAPEFLQSADYEFSAIMLLAERGDTAFHALITDARQQKKGLKTVLKLAGCSQDELAGKLLSEADLVLGSDISDTDMLTRLKALFDANP